MEVDTSDPNSSDRFRVHLSRHDVRCLLRRLSLFHKHRVLDPSLHEMVFEDGLGGYFCAWETLDGGDAVQHVRPARDMVICVFDAVDFSGTGSEIGAWYVREDGRLCFDRDVDRYLAVQWRRPSAAGKGLVYSEPVWEDELRDILTDLWPSGS